MEAYFVAVWAAVKGGLAALALITVLDVVFGIVEAVVHHKFEWQALMHFVNTDIIPIFAWIAIVMLKLIPAILLPQGYTIPVISEVFYAGVFISIVGSFFKSLAELGVLTGFFDKAGFIGAEHG